MHKQTLWIFFFNQIQKWNQLFSREKINKFHTYTWNIIVVANSFGQETIPNFPSKNWRAFSLIIWNTFHYTWSGHSGLRSANSTRLDRARLIVPKEERKMKEKNRKIQHFFLALAEPKNMCRSQNSLPPEDFGHTSIGNLKNSWNITWPGSWMSQFNDFLSCRVRQRASIDIYSSELIYTTMSWKMK